MADIYTIGEALQRSKLLSDEDGYRTYCDGVNHYIATPSNVAPSCGCNCGDANAEKPLQDPIARPRFEIYNKDADFFWDHKTGGLFWLQLSSGDKPNYSLHRPDCLVEKIVTLLNRDDNATILLQTPPESTC